MLHIQKAKGVAGSERQLVNLLSGLEERGTTTRMCVLAAGDSQRFVEQLREFGIDTVEVPAGMDFNPLLVPRLVREIKSFRPDLVHTHLIHADVYGQLAARLAAVPGVSSMHSTHAFYRRQPWRSAARVAGRLARRQIAISEHVADFAIDLGLVPSAYVRLIHYGIDATRWSCAPSDRSAARKVLNLAPQDIVVGVASRLIPLKGHDFLLDGFEAAHKDVPELRLLVAGDGPLRTALETDALRRFPDETVRFLGFIDDMRRFMSGCDVFVVPTHPDLSEGFGLSALEAMAAELPVIGTRVGSLPEVIVDGQTGVIVNPNDVTELSATLTMLARDGKTRALLGHRGRERAEKAFGLESMVGKVMHVYSEIL